MRLIHGLRESEGAGIDTVNITDRTILNSRDSGVCHSGIRVGSNGVLYRIQANGGFSALSGQWLVNGTASDFYMQRTILSGTLEVDAGAGWIQCNVNRDFDNQQATAGNKMASIFVEISNDMSGVPVLDSATFEFESEQGLL